MPMVNQVETHVFWQKKYARKFMDKLIVPYKFPLVMGNEFCSIIEKTGANVKGFAVGDRVYARMPLAKIGAFAEYTAIDYRAIAKVPEYLSDEEAATVPLTALTALQSYELIRI